MFPTITSIEQLTQLIETLAKKYTTELAKRLIEREQAMNNDDISHYLIYKTLGISESEGHLIDLYQNKGRFLYKYAGTFLEEVTFLCFKYKFPHAIKTRIPNNLGNRPKTFEIDCLVGNEAYEVKWRDATTDGDHIVKEHNRVKAIQNFGYKPIRIMYFYPNRDQAISIQKKLQTLYLGVHGEYVFGEEAWAYVERKTDVNLLHILSDLVVNQPASDASHNMSEEQ